MCPRCRPHQSQVAARIRGRLLQRWHSGARHPQTRERICPFFAGASASRQSHRAHDSVSPPCRLANTGMALICASVAIRPRSLALTRCQQQPCMAIDAAHVRYRSDNTHIAGQTPSCRVYGRLAVDHIQDETSGRAAASPLTIANPL